MKVQPNRLANLRPITAAEIAAERERQKAADKAAMDRIKAKAR